MPDLTAGSTILALDTPPAVMAEDSTDLSSIGSTAFIPGSPACSTTFVAGTTGRAEVHVYGRLWTNGTTRIFLSYEVYQGTDASGTLIQAGSDNNAVVTKENGADEGQGMTDTQTGLTPGATYFVRTVHRVASATGSTGNVAHRRVIVSPST